jgi:hypothetical protein
MVAVSGLRRVCAAAADATKNNAATANALLLTFEWAMGHLLSRGYTFYRRMSSRLRKTQNISIG